MKENAPPVNRNKLPWFTGDNSGVIDSATTGPCCKTMIQEISRAHSLVTHDTPASRSIAMRQDLLSNIHLKVRPSIAVFDQYAPWEDLVDHFMDPPRTLP